MRPALTRSLLAAGLVATLALIWLAPAGDEEAAAPAVDKSRRSRPLGSASPARPEPTPGALRPLARMQSGEPAADLFQSRSWERPPAAPLAASAPPLRPGAPSAPPLPFAYLGHYVEDGAMQILLAHGDRVLSVAPGAIIDPDYRVRSMTDGRLTFVYLPLQLEQSLMTGVPQ